MEFFVIFYSHDNSPYEVCISGVSILELAWTEPKTFLLAGIYYFTLSICTFSIETRSFVVCSSDGKLYLITYCLRIQILFVLTGKIK